MGGAGDGWEGEEPPETTREGAEGRSRTTAWVVVGQLGATRGRRALEREHHGQRLAVP